jgi:hypothetical protein
MSDTSRLQPKSLMWEVDDYSEARSRAPASDIEFSARDTVSLVRCAYPEPV